MHETEYRHQHHDLLCRAVFELANDYRGYPVEVHCALPGYVYYRAIEMAAGSLEPDQELWICGHESPEVRSEIRQRFPSACFQQAAWHAGDQAAWLACQIFVKKPKALAFYAPRFHLVRSFLTAIEAMRRRGAKCVLIPVPVENDAEGDHWAGPSDKHLEHERKALVDYSLPKSDGSTGDVASPAYFFTGYLPWFKDQTADHFRV